MSRSPRLRSAVVAGVLLATAVPMVATATAPHLTCAPTPVGRWETIRVQSFTPISGIAASDHDVVETYSLARTKPQDVAATNGYTVLLSHTHGCAWSKAFELNPTVSGTQSFVGAQSHRLGGPGRRRRDGGGAGGHRVGEPTAHPAQHERGYVGIVGVVRQRTARPGCSRWG